MFPFRRFTDLHANEIGTFPHVGVTGQVFRKQTLRRGAWGFLGGGVSVKGDGERSP